MSIVLDRDALRDAAVGIATALPVVAVAYYTVRGSDPHPALPPGEMVGFDLPQRFQNRVGSGLIQLLGRVPVAGAKVWVGESTLIAADGSFLRSFGPGVLAALICISLNGSPVWLALSLIFLFAAIGQLITYVTITAMTRRAALSAAGKRTMHTSRSADTTADRDILDKLGWLY